jgi:hypothetical protein
MTATKFTNHLKYSLDLQINIKSKLFLVKWFGKLAISDKIFCHTAVTRHARV